jgi:hypothetical protein
VLNALKNKVKTTLHPDSLAYNGLARIYNALPWIYSYLALRPPEVRRDAYMWAFKDSRFTEDELSMASSRPEHLLDAVLERYHPASFLDVGCGVGYSVAIRGRERYRDPGP